MESIIKWKTGEPEKSGSYLVTVKGKYSEFVTCAMYNCLLGWVHWKEEEITAWCILEKIKPYKDE